MDMDKDIIVGALYRLPNTYLHYMDALCTPIATILRENKLVVVWIGGDLNLHDINWDSQTVVSN